MQERLLLGYTCGAMLAPGVATRNKCASTGNRREGSRRLFRELKSRRYDPAAISELVGDLPPHAHLVTGRVEHHPWIEAANNR